MNATIVQHNPVMYATHLTPAPPFQPTPPKNGVWTCLAGGRMGPSSRVPAYTVTTSAGGDRTQKTGMEWNMESCFCRHCAAMFYSIDIIDYSTVQ